MNQFYASSRSVVFSRSRGVTRFLARAVLMLCVLAILVAMPAQSVPMLVSVSPAIGATNAAPRGSVVFVFDQAMDTTTPLLATIGTFLIGNYEFSPASVNSLLSGRWGADRRSLTIQPSGPIPLNTTVSWTLNPAGATAPLKRAKGQPLETVTAYYTIASNYGGR